MACEWTFDNKCVDVIVDVKLLSEKVAVGKNVMNNNKISIINIWLDMGSLISRDLCRATLVIESVYC